jgi:hypothetical protein
MGDRCFDEARKIWQLMTKNLLFVQTGEEYFQEITNLTQEIKKLAQFKHMVENKIILPIGELLC